MAEEIHGITSDDWGTFQQLMRDYRAGRLTKTAPPAPSPPTIISGPELCVAILTEPLQGGGTAVARRLNRTAYGVLDIYMWAALVADFSLIHDKVNYRITTINFDADKMLAKLREIYGKEAVLSVQFGGINNLCRNRDGRYFRWRAVFAGSSDRINETLSAGDLDTQVAIRSIPYLDSGEDIIVQSLAPTDELPAGRQVICENVGGDWTVIEAERYTPPVVAAPSPSIRPGLACPSTQLVPAGVTLAPVCGDNTPDYFTFSNLSAWDGIVVPTGRWTGFPQAWPFDPETGLPLNANLIPLKLIHDADNVFKTDVYGPDDAWYWQLTLIETDSGPTAKLELISTSEEYDLYLIYYAIDGWDCLGQNQCRRIAHLCRGNAEFAPYQWPACITLSAGKTGCGDAPNDGSYDFARDWDCSSYLQTVIGTTVYVAGPSEQGTGGLGNQLTGCIFPASNDVSGRSLEVSIFTGLDLSSSSGKFIVYAKLSSGNGAYSYQLQGGAAGNAYPMPSCWGFKATFVGVYDGDNITASERPDSLPESITIRAFP